MAAIPSSGSFGAASGGGGSAIVQAMQSRGLDPGVLNQVTPGAPTSPERGLPQPVGARTSNAIPQQRPAQQGIGQPPTTAESEIIVKALDSRLKTLGKLQEAGIQV